MNFNNFMIIMFLLLVMILIIMKMKFKLVMEISLFMNFVVYMYVLVSIFYFKNFLFNYKSSFISVKLMMLSLMMMLMFFSLNNLIFFFLVFELSIIPMFFFMIFFSLTEKKIISSMYLLIYTSIFSLVSILFLINLIKISKTNNLILYYTLIKLDFNLFNLFLVLMFLVKIPIFFLHIWLPKVHVEASSFGSMILASIMLKLGAFGLMLFMNMKINSMILIILISILLLSSIYIFLLCFFLNDYKMVIAYFSVSHMSLVLISIILKFYLNLSFSMMMMFSHSISSSLLFFFSSMFYNFSSSRMMNKIFSLFFHSKFVFWNLYLLFLMNISVPPTMNFFSELMIIKNIMKFNLFLSLKIIIMFILSGLVSIFLMLKMFYKKEKNLFFSFSSNMSFSYILVFNILMFIYFTLFLKNF